MQDWIERLLAHPELVRMGHHQRAEDANLGLGWVYYGLVRALRPTHAVVIGSWRGFVPLVIGRAMTDNAEGGEVTFIDPSLVDDFWRDPERVSRWFAGFDVHNVTHHCLTTQAFVASEHFAALDPVGLLFVDGYHSHAQAAFDHAAFEPLLSPDGVVLFHDTRRVRPSHVYGEGRTYEHRVKDYVETLARRDDLEVLNLPAADGVTIVRRAGDA